MSVSRTHFKDLTVGEKLYKFTLKGPTLVRFEGEFMMNKYNHPVLSFKHSGTKTNYHSFHHTDSHSRFPIGVAVGNSVILFEDDPTKAIDLLVESKESQIKALKSKVANLSLQIEYLHKFKREYES